MEIQRRPRPFLLMRFLSAPDFTQTANQSLDSSSAEPFGNESETSRTATGIEPPTPETQSSGGGASDQLMTSVSTRAPPPEEEEEDEEDEDELGNAQSPDVPQS